MRDKYIIGTKENRFLQIKKDSFLFVDNFELASCFDNIHELISFEDRYSNDILEFTYHYKIVKNASNDTRTILITE